MVSYENSSSATNKLPSFNGPQIAVCSVAKPIWKRLKRTAAPALVGRGQAVAVAPELTAESWRQCLLVADVATHRTQMIGLFT